METILYLALILLFGFLLALGVVVFRAVAITKPFKRTYADGQTETDRQLTHKEMEELCWHGRITPGKKIITISYLSTDTLPRIV